MPIPGSEERFESHVDRLIREAEARGEFDDLPGAGEPIPGAGSVDDPLWWIRGWVKRSLAADPAEPEDQGSNNAS